MSSYECLYKWEAIFKDGSKLQQFDLMGKETNFSEVIKRMNDLKQFNLSGGKHNIILDLKNGFFYVDGLRLIPSYKEIEILTEAVSKRLIYFRTVGMTFGAESGTYVYYCIGFQATVDGENIKHILRISPEESIIFE